MAVAAISANVGNTITAEAVAGAHSLGQKSGENKTDFSDVLNAILSGQNVQQQAPQTQDNIPAQKYAALAQVKDALDARTAVNGDTTDGSADAASALAAKITGASSAAPQPGTAANGDKTDFADAVSTLAATITGASSTAPQNIATQNTVTQTTGNITAPDNSMQTAQKSGGKSIGVEHAALTAATQAKLVSALAQAANMPPKIVGSDGKTAASSDRKGTPSAAADAQTAPAQPEQTETPADVVNVLAAMPTAQPVVTTIQTDADRTAASVTFRTMPQLEKAALDNTVRQAVHSATPAEKTVAQALSMPADGKTAQTQSDSGAQTGSDPKQPQNADNAKPLAANPTKMPDAQAQPMIPPQAPQPAAQAPVEQTAATTATANMATAIGNAAQAQSATTAPAAVVTALQVAQQTTASSATPDLAALAISIAAKSKDGQNEFNIRMEPAELGRVDVRLSVDAAGKAQAHLTADKPQTLEMLQRDSQTLERSLKDSGLDLSNNGLNFSLKGQQQNSSPTFVARNRALSINTVQTTDTASTSGTSTAPGDSRLDIRV